MTSLWKRARMAGMSAEEFVATRRGQMASERSQQWHAEHAALVLSELVGRGLSEEDVVGSDDVWALYGAGDVRRRGISELAARVGSPPPEPLFVVGRSRYWLYDDVLAWLAPALARRWDTCYELRCRDVVLRWKRAHARRRSPRGRSRYGFQGVSRVAYAGTVLDWVRKAGVEVRPTARRQREES